MASAVRSPYLKEAFQRVHSAVKPLDGPLAALLTQEASKRAATGSIPSKDEPIDDALTRALVLDLALSVLTNFVSNTDDNDPRVDEVELLIATTSKEKDRALGKLREMSRSEYSDVKRDVLATILEGLYPPSEPENHHLDQTISALEDRPGKFIDVVPRAQQPAELAEPSQAESRKHSDYLEDDGGDYLIDEEVVRFAAEEKRSSQAGLPRRGSSSSAIGLNRPRTGSVLSASSGSRQASFPQNTDNGESHRRRSSSHSDFLLAGNTSNMHAFEKHADVAPRRPSLSSLGDFASRSSKGKRPSNEDVVVLDVANQVQGEGTSLRSTPSRRRAPLSSLGRDRFNLPNSGGGDGHRKRLGDREVASFLRSINRDQGTSKREQVFNKYFQPISESEIIELVRALEESREQNRQMRLDEERMAQELGKLVEDLQSRVVEVQRRSQESVGLKEEELVILRMAVKDKDERIASLKQSIADLEGVTSKDVEREMRALRVEFDTEREEWFKITKEAEMMRDDFEKEREAMRIKIESELRERFETEKQEAILGAVEIARATANDEARIQLEEFHEKMAREVKETKRNLFDGFAVESNLVRDAHKRELAALGDKLNASSEALAQAEEEKRCLEQEKNMLMTNLNQVKGELTKASEIAESLRKDRLSLEGHIQEIKEGFDKERDEMLEAMDAEKSELVESINAEWTRKMNDLEQRFETTELLLVREQNELVHVTNERARLEQKLSETESSLGMQLKELTSRCDSLTTSIAQSQSLNEQLQSQIAESRSVGETLQSELEESRAYSGQMQTRAEEYQSQIEELHLQANQTQSVIEQLRSDLQRVQSHSEELESTIRQFQSQSQSSNDKMSQLQSQLADSQLKVQELQTQLLRADDFASETVEHVDALRRDLDGAEAQCVSLQAQLDEKVTRLALAENDLQQSQFTVIQIQEELSMTEARRDQLEYQLSDLLKQLAQSHSAQEILQNQCSEAEQASSSSATMNANLELRVSALTDQLAESQSRVSVLTQQLHETQSHLTDLIAQLHESQSNVTTLTAQLQNAQSLVEAITTGGEDTNARIDHMQRDATESRMRLERELVETRSQLSSVQAELSDTAARFLGVQSELESRGFNHDTTVAELRRELAEERTRTAELELIVSQEQERSMELESLVASTNAQVSGLEAKMRDADRATFDAIGQVRLELESQLRESQRTCLELESQLAEANRLCEENSKELKVSQTRLQELVSVADETNRISQEGENARAMNESVEVETLRSERVELSGMIASLLKEHESLNVQCEELEAQVRMLREQQSSSSDSASSAQSSLSNLVESLKADLSSAALREQELVALVDILKTQKMALEEQVAELELTTKQREEEMRSALHNAVETANAMSSDVLSMEREEFAAKISELELRVSQVQQQKDDVEVELLQTQDMLEESKRSDTFEVNRLAAELRIAKEQARAAQEKLDLETRKIRSDYESRARTSSRARDASMLNTAMMMDSSMLTTFSDSHLGETSNKAKEILEEADSLKSQLRESLIKLNTAQGELDSLRSQVSQLKSLRDSGASHGDMQEELESLRSQATIDQDMIRSQVAQLDSMRHLLDDAHAKLIEFNSMQMQLETLKGETAELDNMRHQMIDLREQLETLGSDQNAATLHSRIPDLEREIRRKDAEMQALKMSVASYSVSAGQDSVDVERALRDALEFQRSQFEHELANALRETNGQWQKFHEDEVARRCIEAANAAREMAEDELRLAKEQMLANTIQTAANVPPKDSSTRPEFVRSFSDPSAVQSYSQVTPQEMDEMRATAGSVRRALETVLILVKEMGKVTRSTGQDLAEIDPDARVNELLKAVMRERAVFAKGMLHLQSQAQSPSLAIVSTSEFNSHTPIAERKSVSSYPQVKEVDEVPVSSSSSSKMASSEAEELEMLVMDEVELL